MSDEIMTPETNNPNPEPQPKSAKPAPPGFTMKPAKLKRPMDKTAMNNDLAVLNSLAGTMNAPGLRVAAEDAGKVAETVGAQARSNARAYRRPTGNRGEVLPPADPLTGSNQYDPNMPNVPQPRVAATVQDTDEISSQPQPPPAQPAARRTPADSRAAAVAISATQIVELLKQNEEMFARLLGVCHQLNISPSPDPVTALRIYLINRNLKFVFKQLGVEA